MGPRGGLLRVRSLSAAPGPTLPPVSGSWEKVLCYHPCSQAPSTQSRPELQSASLALPPRSPWPSWKTLPLPGFLESLGTSPVQSKGASQGHQAFASQAQTFGPVPGPPAPNSPGLALPPHSPDGSCHSGSVLPLHQDPSLLLDHEAGSKVPQPEPTQKGIRTLGRAVCSGPAPSVGDCRMQL